MYTHSNGGEQVIHEDDYDLIVCTVIKDNPFVSGNHGGFGLNTPMVPDELSLMPYIEQPSKRKASTSFMSCPLNQHIDPDIKSAKPCFISALSEQQTQPCHKRRKTNQTHSLTWVV